MECIQMEAVLIVLFVVVVIAFFTPNPEPPGEDSGFSGDPNSFNYRDWYNDQGRK